MIKYLSECELVITDSGGLVREAFYSKKKCLLILENALWPEIVEQKYCINVSASRLKILNGYDKLLLIKQKNKSGIFGNGKAANFIVKKIYNYIR